METIIYICPDCGKELLQDGNMGLRCPNGDYYPYLEGTGVPVFACEDETANEYTRVDAGEIHDNSLKWLFATFGGSEEEMRAGLTVKLRLQRGQSVLVTGVGAGNDLPYIAEMIGKEGEIYAQDYSVQMLSTAIDRVETLYHLDGYRIEFSAGDAVNLPFPDNYFDAAYHFGGLNLFSSVEKGIGEMNRVVKNGGRIVFGDEGIAPWLRDTDYGKIVINNNPLCRYEPPLNYIPDSARDVNLTWMVGNCFYVIDYTVSDTPIPVNLDVTHVGKRGGSMRTRYYGKLEGIDPELRDQLYAEAEKRGVSRVDLLEKILRKGLKD